MLIGSFFTHNIELEEMKVVELGTQIFQFSSLDYPLANESGIGAKPLFALKKENSVHSVYLDFQRDYGFEEAFSDTYVRGFFSAIHALNSPNLNEFKIQPHNITLDKGSVLVDEGNYILEFFPSSRGSQDTNIRFLKFITDNISEIRTDIEKYKVATSI